MYAYDAPCEKNAEGREAYYDQKASYQKFSIGDKVWYYSFVQHWQTAPHRLSKKFLSHWTGPHEIVDKLSPVTYRIKITQRRNEPVLRWVHRNQLKGQSSTDTQRGETKMTDTGQSEHTPHLGNIDPVHEQSP